MNIGRYKINKEIGRGSMGVVYSAYDPNLDITLALKVLRKDRLTSESFVRRFMAEARALGRLDYPEIVRVYNVDQDAEEVYIAMEFINGEPISSMMNKQQFSSEAIVDFGVRIADALDYAHRKGIIHRDVKPSNIICTTDGKLKITDFGIAHIEDPAGVEETQAGEILGTPAYMSPEQVLGRQVDGRSDLFSLGIILYEMATGLRPFQGQGINAIFMAITSSTPTSINSINPAIPKSLSEAIMRCLNKEPEARYADCKELATALRSANIELILAETNSTIPTEKNENKWDLGGHRKKVIFALCIALTILLTAFFIVVPRTHTENIKVKSDQSDAHRTLSAPPDIGAQLPPTDRPPETKAVTHQPSKEAILTKNHVKVATHKKIPLQADIEKPNLNSANIAKPLRDTVDPDCLGCTCQDLLTTISMGISTLTPSQLNYLNRNCKK